MEETTQTPRFEDRIGRFCKAICRIGNVLAPVLVVCVMLLIVSDVFLRTFFKSPIKGSVELTECMIACAGFLAMGWCTILDKNIRIDMVVQKLPKRASAFLDTVTSFISLAVVPLLAWQSGVRVLDAVRYNEATSILNMPLFPVFIVVTFAYIMLFFAQLSIFINYLMKGVRGT